MRNTRGQLGKALTFLPSLLLIFVISLFFIALTVNISAFKHVRAPVLDSSFSGDSVLFTKSSFVIDGVEKEMSLLEAFLKYRDQTMSSDVFAQGLEKIVNPQQPCLAFAWSYWEKPSQPLAGTKARDVFFVEWNEEAPVLHHPGYEIPLQFPLYISAGVMQSTLFSFKGETTYVDSYLGRCIYE